MEEFNDGWALPPSLHTSNSSNNGNSDDNTDTRSKRRTAVDDKDGQQASGPNDTSSV